MSSEDYKIEFNSLFEELLNDIKKQLNSIEFEKIIFKVPIIQNTLQDTDINGKTIKYGNIQLRGITKSNKFISQGTGKMDDIYDESMEIDKSNISDIILLVEVLEILESKDYKIETLNENSNRYKKDR